MKIQEIDFAVDLVQSLLWQYNEAPNLQSIVYKKQEWYTAYQSAYWSDWYNDVFNLVTANEFGLAVWSIILNIPLYLEVDPEDPGKPIFGFNEDPPINDYVNFGFGTFSSRNQVIILSTEEQRLLLRLRYYQLVSRGAIPEINTFLAALFANSEVPYQGSAWALDGFNMTMVYVFDFNIPRRMRQVIRELDLLPRPAGVGLEYRVLTGTIFGFGTFNQNFENGNFYPDFPF